MLNLHGTQSIEQQQNRCAIVQECRLNGCELAKCREPITISFAARTTA